MPEPKIKLAGLSDLGIPLCGMRKDKLLLELLEALVRSWLETMTPIEIGADLDRVRLLKAARAGVERGQPSSLVCEVYREVFLTDVWSCRQSDPGGAATG
jgi:hypothetical protein